MREGLVAALAAAYALASCGGRAKRGGVAQEARNAGGTTGVVASGGAGASSPGAGGSSSGAPMGAGQGGVNGDGKANWPVLLPDQPAACPQQFPIYRSDCSSDVPASGCAYTADCQAGTHVVTLVCNQRLWTPPAGADCQIGDFCNAEPYQLICDRYGWTFAGGGDTATCSPVRPTHGASCFYGGSEVYRPACGYFCPDGTWTVTSCGGPYPNMSVMSDPPCPGEELPVGGAAGASDAAGASGVSTASGGEGGHS
jgi:hypothetical protein